jgi:hypothetical protein
MDARTLEFDHFGPWVLEIAPDDPPPPIFVPYLRRPEELLLAVKVPRPIDRRSAYPGMDLYDYLICLYPDELEIMHREDHAVRRRIVPYRDIGHLSVTCTLLRGNLHLGVPGVACDVPFNTTADRPIGRVIELIRDRYHRPATGPGIPAEADADEAGLSFYFRNLLASVRETRPEVRLLAVQGTIPLARHETTTARRFLSRAAGRRLLESLHIWDGRELLIIDRGRRYADRWHSVYGNVTSYVPLAAIRGTAWEDVASGGVSAVTIRTDGGSLSHAFTQANPSIGAYRDYLSRLTAGAAHVGPTRAADLATRL